MKKISAEIVADSINPQGNRITTMLLTYPRFIHGEVLTHRVFSKNSASSRAIPFEKMVKMVEEDPFIPIAWQKDHKGMQGNEYLTHVEANKEDWLKARDYAVEYAENLNNGGEGVTKQICNRLLEPFMWHTVLLTGTEFENFFELRCPKYLAPENSLETIGRVFRSKRDMIQFYIDNDFKLGAGALKMWTILDWLKANQSQAEIHMQALAEAMWDAMNESTPKELEEGEWHIPFGDKIDDMSLALITDSIKNVFQVQEGYARKYENTSKELDEVKIKIATARCARLSYMTFDGEIDYEKDIKLHDTLLESHHMSPFEHCARAMSNLEYFSHHKGMVDGEFDSHSEIGSFFRILEEAKFMSDKRNGWCNNFRGFIQYRYLIENYYDGFKI